MDRTELDGSSSTEAPQQCCREAARAVGEAAGAAMEESAAEASSSGDSVASAPKAVSPVSAPQQELKQQQQQQGVKRHHHKHNLKHRYELQETLGKGTYGKVKRAIERFSGRVVRAERTGPGGAAGLSCRERVGGIIEASKQGTS